MSQMRSEPTPSSHDAASIHHPSIHPLQPPHHPHHHHPASLKLSKRNSTPLSRTARSVFASTALSFPILTYSTSASPNPKTQLEGCVRSVCLNSVVGAVEASVHRKRRKLVAAAAVKVKARTRLKSSPGKQRLVVQEERKIRMSRLRWSGNFANLKTQMCAPRTLIQVRTTPLGAFTSGGGICHWTGQRVGL